MKTLLLFSSSEMGGAERSLSRMAMETSLKDVEYQLATLGGEGPWSKWILSQNNIPMVSGGGFAFLALWRLVHYVRCSKTNVLYVCGSRASLYLRLLKFTMPNVRMVHGVRWNPNSKSRLDRFVRFIERATHPLIDAWITNSAIAKETLVKRCKIKSDNVFVIYNGLQCPKVDIPPVGDRLMEVLTVANLNKRKGYIEYLSIVKEVLKEVPEAKFVFVGHDYMNGLVQDKIKKEGLDKNVRCVGFQKDVSKWFKRARVFVLPSLRGEGCPTSILEAMSWGLPIVSYSIDGIPELVVNNVNGILIKLGDKDRFKDAIVKLIREPSQINGNVNDCKELVAKQFSIKKCASIHAEVLSKISSS